MNWYDAYTLKESLREISQFLIDLAEFEAEIEYFGLSAVKKIDNYKDILKKLEEVPEKFSLVKRGVSFLDKIYFNKLDRAENDEKLIDQLCLMSLKIRIALKSNRKNLYQSGIGRILFRQLKFFTKGHPNKIFGEESISVERMIISMQKLISDLAIIEEIFRAREQSDDDLFKPSNVDGSHVLVLIGKAIDELESSNSINFLEKQRLASYLNEARIELESGTPKWPKVISALVIVAAITSGLSDAPNAAKAIQSALEYILKASVEQPSQLRIPNNEHEESVVSSPRTISI